MEWKTKRPLITSLEMIFSSKKPSKWILVQSGRWTFTKCRWQEAQLNLLLGSPSYSGLCYFKLCRQHVVAWPSEELGKRTWCAGHHLGILSLRPSWVQVVCLSMPQILGPLCFGFWTVLDWFRSYMLQPRYTEEIPNTPFTLIELNPVDAECLGEMEFVVWYHFFEANVFFSVRVVGNQAQAVARRMWTEAISAISIEQRSQRTSEDLL